MDKWDDLVTRTKHAVLAEEADAALTAGLGLFAEFGRTLELMGADLDRLATAAEGLLAAAERTASGAQGEE